MSSDFRQGKFNPVAILCFFWEKVISLHFFFTKIFILKRKQTTPKGISDNKATGAIYLRQMEPNGLTLTTMAARDAFHIGWLSFFYFLSACEFLRLRHSPSVWEKKNPFRFPPSGAVSVVCILFLRPTPSTRCISASIYFAGTALIFKLILELCQFSFEFRSKFC